MSTLLVNNAYIVTMDDRQREIPDGGLFIRDGFIEQVSATRELPSTADAVLDLTDHLVLPGLVNTHHHFYQTLTRAIPAAQDANLFTWLTTLYPLWARLHPADIFTSAQTALAELALSGCTTASDHLYLFPNGARLDDEIAAAHEVGLRLHAARGSMSLGESQGGLPPDAVVDSEDAILRDSQRVIEHYHDPRPGAMVQIVLAPCSPFSVTTPSTGGALLHRFVEAQAARTPDAAAVVWAPPDGPRVELTYAELDRRAAGLALRLAALGVGPEVRVGVALERTADLPVALLAILKAGGAYVPLDPGYPAPRLTAMIDDARLGQDGFVVLTQERLLPQVTGVLGLLDGELDTEGPTGELGEELNREEAPGRRVTSRCGLFTSSASIGSRPAGLPTRSCFILVTPMPRTSPTSSTPRARRAGPRAWRSSTAAPWRWCAGRATVVPAPRSCAGVLASTSICFDLSVFELFVPLAWGGKGDPGRERPGAAALAGRGEVTLVNTVPSAMAELVRAGARARPRCGRSTWRASRCRGALVERIYALADGRAAAQPLRPVRGHDLLDLRRACRAAATRADDRPADRRTRGPTCSTRAWRAGAGRRAGRALPRRRRAGARLPRPAGADGRALRARSVRRPSRARGSTAPATWCAGCRTASSSSWAASTTR